MSEAICRPSPGAGSRKPATDERITPDREVDRRYSSCSTFEAKESRREATAREARAAARADAL
ncbi:MAG: hypothetical protein R5N60_05670 [Cutibacterium granulosum]|nr:hypothetical protein [Cutibacterium granulosum]